MAKSFLLFAMVFSVFMTGTLAPGALSEAIYDAEYPASIPMPDQSDYLTKDGEWDFEAYYDDYDRWMKDAGEKRLKNGEAQALLGCFSRISGEILTGADGENKVFSPVNVYLALSMLSEITDGTTRSEILSFLSADSIEALRRQASAVFMSVYENDGQTTSIPAASVWLRNDISYKPDALKTLSKDYFASSFEGEMGSPEYDAQIQKWLSEATGGLLDEQAKGVTFDPDTIIALATSLYFKAGWESEFSKSGTCTDVFHAPSGDTQAEFMRKGGTDTYYRGENFGAVALTLTNRGNMWFILPDEGVSPESLFASDDIFTLIESPFDWENRKHLIVNKRIPKFDVTGETDLIAILKNLGITAAFDPTASDFTPLTDIPEIVVSKAQHDARVKIDEQGVEAAAYTVIMAMATSARPPEEEMDFIVDRPFAFVITSPEGLPLFTGIVNETGK